MGARQTPLGKGSGDGLEKPLPRFTEEETEAAEENGQQLLSPSASSLLWETQQGAG